MPLVTIYTIIKLAFKFPYIPFVDPFCIQVVLNLYTSMQKLYFWCLLQAVIFNFFFSMFLRFSWVPHKQIFSINFFCFSGNRVHRYSISLSFLSFMIGSFSLDSLASYGRSLMHWVLLVAALCILVIFLCGDHTTAAYSSFGQISDTINFLIISSKYVNTVLNYLSSDPIYVILATSYLKTLLCSFLSWFYWHAPFPLNDFYFVSY